MRLSRYLASMTIFLLAVAAVGVWLVARLESAFLANPLLNAVLIAVWLIGIAYIILQTIRLAPEVKWVREVQRNRLAVKDLEPPPLLGSLARLMESRTTPLSLTPTALRAVLDSVAVRLDESREIARYFIGLMIFLGLLGTFWGLLRTVGSVGAVVNGLSVTADPTELFTSLKSGLQGPLVGMGTAFGSSLLGLAGSLVLGFLDLQMGQAQTRFFLDLENWLFASAGASENGLGEEIAPLPVIQALVDKTAANIDGLRQIMVDAEEGRRHSAEALWAMAGHIDSFRKTMGESEESRRQSSEALSALAGNLDSFRQTMTDAEHSGRHSVDALRGLADKIDALVAAEENQQRVIEAMLTQRMEADAAMARLLNRFDEALSAGELGGGKAVAGHLAAIEAGIGKLVDEQSETRARALDEARAEIGRLARTIGIITDEKAGL